MFSRFHQHSIKIELWKSSELKLIKNLHHHFHHLNALTLFYLTTMLYLLVSWYKINIPNYDI
jgi:hypothetical protein